MRHRHQRDLVARPTLFNTYLPVRQLPGEAGKPECCSFLFRSFAGLVWQMFRVGYFYETFVAGARGRHLQGLVSAVLLDRFSGPSRTSCFGQEGRMPPVWVSDVFRPGPTYLQGRRFHLKCCGRRRRPAGCRNVREFVECADLRPGDPFRLGRQVRPTSSISCSYLSWL